MAIFVSIIIFLVFLAVAPKAIKKITLWIFLAVAFVSIFGRIVRPFYSFFEFNTSSWNNFAMWNIIAGISIPVLMIFGIIVGLVGNKIKSKSKNN